MCLHIYGGTAALPRYIVLRGSVCVSAKKEVGRSDQWGETGGLGFWRYGGGGRRFRFKSAGVRIGPTNRLLS